MWRAAKRVDDRRQLQSGSGASTPASSVHESEGLDTSLPRQRPSLAATEGHDRLLYRPPVAPLCAQRLLSSKSGRGRGPGSLPSPIATGRSEAASEEGDGAPSDALNRRVHSGLRAARGRRAAMEARGVRVVYEEDEDGYYTERVIGAV